MKIDIDSVLLAQKLAIKNKKIKIQKIKKEMKVFPNKTAHWAKSNKLIELAQVESEIYSIQNVFAIARQYQLKKLGKANHVSSFEYETEMLKN